MIIDQSYFVGHLHIGQTRFTQMDEFIDIYERDYLYRTLDGVTVQAINDGDLEAHKIVKGETYEHEGQTYKWIGLNDRNHSPIAHYVYFNYVRAQFTQSSSVGEVKPRQENAAFAHPRTKLVSAWNHMVDMTVGCPAGLVSLEQYMSDVHGKSIAQRDYFEPINQFGI